MINTNIFADGKPLPIVLRQACILSDKARRNLSKGHIVNLMSTDIETFYTVRIQSILNSFVSMNSSLQFTHPQADRQTDRQTHTHTDTHTHTERERFANLGHTYIMSMSQRYRNIRRCKPPCCHAVSELHHCACPRAGSCRHAGDVYGGSR